MSGGGPGDDAQERGDSHSRGGGPRRAAPGGRPSWPPNSQRPAWPRLPRLSSRRCRSPSGQQAVFDYASDERLRWHFIPNEMFPAQGPGATRDVGGAAGQGARPAQDRAQPEGLSDRHRHHPARGRAAGDREQPAVRTLAPRLSVHDIRHARAARSHGAGASRATTCRSTLPFATAASCRLHHSLPGPIRPRSRPDPAGPAGAGAARGRGARRASSR